MPVTTGKRKRHVAGKPLLGRAEWLLAGGLAVGVIIVSVLYFSGFLSGEDSLTAELHLPDLVYELLPERAEP